MERNTNILLAVTGLTPQVITEAVYGLMVQGRLVHEVHAITTREGGDLIHARLLASGTGALFRLQADYHLPAIHFPPENIHILEDGRGGAIDEITTPEENEALLSTCMEWGWRLTSRKETAVFFLIAGGRKTMSAALAVAAQFYGRPQDRVYHVLLSPPPLEGGRDFFYPPPEPREIAVSTPEGRFLVSTADARVELISMPFFSVRRFLGGEALAAPAMPEELKMFMVREEPPRLVLDLRARKVIYKGVELDMPPLQMALMGFFARLRLECGCQPPGCPRCFLEVGELMDRAGEVVEIYRYLLKRAGLPPREQKCSLMDEDFAAFRAGFNSHRSKINRRLSRFWADPHGRRICIASQGGSPTTRYGLPFPAEMLELRE